MAELDAAIRERLEALADWDDLTAMHAALLAVLDLHAAPERALPGEIHCGELIDWVRGGCPTVRAIAQKLGVEAPRG